MLQEKPENWPIIALCSSTLISCRKYSQFVYVYKTYILFWKGFVPLELLNYFYFLFGMCKWYWLNLLLLLTLLQILGCNGYSIKMAFSVKFSEEQRETFWQIFSAKNRWRWVYNDLNIVLSPKRNYFSYIETLRKMERRNSL